MQCEKIEINSWDNFLDFVKPRTSQTAFENWLAPIQVIEALEDALHLEVPNVFVKEYLLSNYKLDLPAFIPVNADGSLAITFSIAKKPPAKAFIPTRNVQLQECELKKTKSPYQLELNTNYTFENFIEGPANQFVKSAALGVSKGPVKAIIPFSFTEESALEKPTPSTALETTYANTLKSLKSSALRQSNSSTTL